VKLLKTIRADPSDTFVFENAAEPGEWAVSGAFMFARQDTAALTGKARATFRAGFLGVGSFGWSTLVQIVSATEADRVAAVDMLATRLVSHLGAPSLETARLAAEEEVAFAASLCDHPEGMLIAMSRRHEDGEIREMFRVLSPRAPSPGIRPFAFLDAEDADDDAAAEQIDLMALVNGARR
jgi:Family of unknown function (DUF6505)